MIGETIRWNIKIINLTNWIGVGVGLKNIVTDNNFIFTDDEYDKHGCYFVTSDGYSFTYLDK